MASHYSKANNSRYHGGNKTLDKWETRRRIEFLVPRIYAAIASELWNLGWSAEDIQDLFTASQERWQDAARNGWDMLENVAEVTGIDVRYFKQTGDIV